MQRLEEQAQIQQQKQHISDRALLARYPTEQKLIERRDIEIEQNKLLINQTEKIQIQLKQQLTKLQQQAAEQEISGVDLNDKLTQKLRSTQQELDDNRRSIKQLNDETEQITKYFAEEQIRLQKLLKSTQ